MGGIEESPRLRRAGTLALRDLRVGEPLVRRDVVHVPEDAAALLSMEDGTALILSERTLMVIERDATRGTSLELVAGGLRGSAAAASLAIRTGGGSTVVAPGVEVSVVREEGPAGAARVTVHGGAPTLRPSSGAPVTLTGERRRVGPTVVAGPPEKLAIRS